MHPGTVGAQDPQPNTQYTTTPAALPLPLEIVTLEYAEPKLKRMYYIHHPAYFMKKIYTNPFSLSTMRLTMWRMDAIISFNRICPIRD